MTISERFGLKRSQYELDFVDVDTDKDIELFLDPYFIAINDFPFAIQSHLSLKSYFACLLNALKEDRINDAEMLFSHLGETNEICLGFSKSTPRGKGMGPSDAIKIFQSLKQSKALQTGIMENIEDFRIFVDNVDKDKTSDMTANIIKKQLIEYTQAQCNLWDIPLTKEVSSGFFWDRQSNSWKNKYTDMLIIDGCKILLVPKRIVSFSKQYTPQKYKQHFVLNFLQDEQLRLNGPLVQQRKDKLGTPFVTKKSLREDIEKSESINKDWLAQFTAKHPEIFEKFRKETKSKIKPIANNDITFENVAELCSFLEKKLLSICTGGETATVYHRTIVGIIELLFYPHLCAPAIEQEIHEGRKRIDITFDNCAETGFFFRLCNTYDIPSPFIMVECKNYTRDIANPELDQISSRFSPNRGKMGIVACRAINNMDVFLARCADTYQDRRGLVIPLVDDDFITLLHYYAENNNTNIDTFLQNRFHKIAFS